MVKKNIPIMNEQMWELSREVEITQKHQIGRWNEINTFEFTSRWETVEKNEDTAIEIIQSEEKNVKIWRKMKRALWPVRWLSPQQRGERQKN